MREKTQRLIISAGRATRPTTPLVARLAEHLRNPLYRNGYALILSSAITSGLGVLYWILAAHNYTTEAVGLNSAAISAMMFLGGLSQLNLTSALIRFLPGARRATMRLVVSAYLISSVLSVVASLIFLLGIDLWAPSLRGLIIGTISSMWLVESTIGWAIFVLQDAVLTGLRQAIWVPIENTIFSVAKIVLLLFFAQAHPQQGIFASWTLALVVSVLPTNLLIFRRLIPRHAETEQEPTAPMILSQIIRYVVADYFGALCWLATVTLLPLLVTHLAGATANAYFYLCWTIAYSTYLIGPNMGSSLIVEATHNRAKLGDYSYQVFVQTARILVPVILILVVGAPYILQIFGNNYATAGADLLRLLALSAFPNMINSLFISVARVERRMMAIVTVLGLLCGLVLTLSYLFLRVYGIVGIGTAWLISQTAIALILLLSQFRALWSSQVEYPTSVKALMEAVAHSWVPRISTSWGVRFGVEEMLRLMMRYPAIGRHLDILFSRSWYSPGEHRRLGEALKLVKIILPRIPPLANTPLPATWVVHCTSRSLSDMTTITLGPVGEPSKAVLKLPQTNHAMNSLFRQSIALAALQADVRLGEWRTLLPEVLTEGTVTGQRYVVEQALPGVDVRTLIADPLMCARIQTSAAATIGQLHRLTAAVAPVNPQLIERWIEQPLRLLHRWNDTLPRTARTHTALKRLEDELRTALFGHTFTISWIHGDFWVGNLLVTPDGTRVTGIVDWDMARPNDLPLLDVLQLLLSTRMLAQQRELGDIMCLLLKRPEWLPYELAILNQARSKLPGDPFEIRTLLLLCWLRHVANNLTKSSRYIGNWLWAARNIKPVLQCL